MAIRTERPNGLGPITNAMFDHWVSIHPPDDGRLPGRQHFHIENLPADIIPHVWLLTVFRDPWRFQYRLIGGALVDAGVLAKRGDFVHQFDKARVFSERLERSCIEKIPVFRRGPPNLVHDNPINELEILTLPFASNGQDVDLLLNVTVYYWQKGYGPESFMSEKY